MRASGTAKPLVKTQASKCWNMERLCTQTAKVPMMQPIMQSVKVCMPVYSRPKMIVKAYMHK